ncbi:MAG: RDD family protein [Nitrospirota bacterium]|nr:RDD family protein [Nitrospirota bacterium]
MNIREPSDRFSYLFDRFLAKFVDYLLALSLEHAGFLLGSAWLARLAAMTYLLVADGLPGGKSLGKILTGVWVSGSKGRPCSFYESTLRNAPIGLAYILDQIPWVGPIFGGAIIGFESLLLIGMRSDRRFGDDLVSTIVRKGAEKNSGKIDLPTESSESTTESTTL